MVAVALVVFGFGFFMGKYKADKTNVDDVLEEFFKRAWGKYFAKQPAKKTELADFGTWITCNGDDFKVKRCRYNPNNADKLIIDVEYIPKGVVHVYVFDKGSSIE